MVIIKWIFNTASSFKKFWNSKELSKWTKIYGVFSGDNLPKIKDGVYTISLDECSDIGTHWVGLNVNNNDGTYFDSFGVEHILKEIKEFVKNKDIKHFLSTSKQFSNVRILLYWIY